MLHLLETAKLCLGEEGREDTTEITEVGVKKGAEDKPASL